MATREQCIAAAGAAWAEGCAAQDELPAREAAEAAWRPGGPSVDELEARITARRARVLGDVA